MLIVEQLISPHSHSHGHGLPLQTVNNQSSASVVEFDAELGDLERDQGTGRSGYTAVSPGAVSVPEAGGDRSRAFPLTLGLIVHALADGLALGVSSITPANPSETSYNLSFIVFLALIIHKGMFYH